MSKYESQELLVALPDMIPAVASHIVASFTKDGFKCNQKDNASNGIDLYFIKNNALGYEMHLKVSLTPHGDSYIKFRASREEFFSEIVRVIFLLLCPIVNILTIFVLIANFVTLATQAKMDDRALSLAKEVINQARDDQPKYISPKQEQFCTYCGATNDANASVCSSCGASLRDDVQEPHVKKPVVLDAPTRARGSGVIMTINSLCRCGQNMLVRGTCTSVICKGDRVKVQTFDESVLVTIVESIEVENRNVSESEVGVEVTLELSGTRLEKIRGGDKVSYA